MGILGGVFDLAGGLRRRGLGEATAATAWARGGMAPVRPAPLCSTRNFPERSGKFRSSRNRSGKIRVIPDDQFLAEKASFYLGLYIGPKYTEIFGDAHNKLRKLPIIFF